MFAFIVFDKKDIEITLLGYTVVNNAHCETSILLKKTITTWSASHHNQEKVLEIEL